MYLSLNFLYFGFFRFSFKLFLIIIIIPFCPSLHFNDHCRSLFVFCFFFHFGLFCNFLLSLLAGFFMFLSISLFWFFSKMVFFATYFLIIFPFLLLCLCFYFCFPWRLNIYIERFFLVFLVWFWLSIESPFCPFCLYLTSYLLALFLSSWTSLPLCSHVFFFSIIIASVYLFIFFFLPIYFSFCLCLFGCFPFQPPQPFCPNCWWNHM